MFDILFGWRKASKCKKLIKRVQCRIKVVRNKRQAIVKQLREDVCALIRIGYAESAFQRAEEIIKDERIIAVYEVLDNFCDFIINNLSYIRRNKDCPNDINEAVSSLIFASARCGDLPELIEIRKLFKERYGQRFADIAVELLPGNLVNIQIKEKLLMKSVSDDVKDRLMDEIARDHCFKPEYLALEFASELHKQEMDRNDQSNYTEIQDFQVHVLDDANEVESKNVDSADGNCLSITYPTHQDSEVVREISPDLSVSLMPDTEENVKTFTSLKPPDATSSVVQIPDEIAISHNEMEEFRSSMERDGDCQDKTTLKFKQLGMSKHRPWSEKVGSEVCRKGKEDSRKRLRRRSMSWESQGMMDIECLIYYGEPRKSSTKKKTMAKQPHNIESKCRYDPTRSSCKKYLNGEMKKRNLEQPCFCCAGHVKDEREFSPYRKMRGGITNIVGLPPLGPKGRNFTNRSLSLYAFVTYPSNFSSQRNTKMIGKEEGFDTTCSSDSSEGCSPTETPYLRAKTMPLERSKEDHTDNIHRSNSCASQYPIHPHPKLPDCDNLAAKVVALKKEHMQNRQGKQLGIL